MTVKIDDAKMARVYIEELQLRDSVENVSRLVAFVREFFEHKIEHLEQVERSAQYLLTQERRVLLKCKAGKHVGLACAECERCPACQIFECEGDAELVATEWWEGRLESNRSETYEKSLAELIQKRDAATWARAMDAAVRAASEPTEKKIPLDVRATVISRIQELAAHGPGVKK